jgi:hypothetical protein
MEEFGVRSTATPRTEHVEEVIEEEIKFQRDTYWKSCCGLVLDKRAIQYLVQVLFSGVILLFCMIKLWNYDDAENITIYVSLLSAILGFWSPTPSLGSDKK